MLGRKTPHFFTFLHRVKQVSNLAFSVTEEEAPSEGNEDFCTWHIAYPATFFCRIWRWKEAKDS